MLILVFASTQLAAVTHPFNVNDLVTMKRISEPQVSPDGKQIVFVVRKTDMEANKGRTDLWIVNIDGSNLRQVTTHPANDYNPRWSSDGKDIWFLSTRTDIAQIRKISASAGESQQITDLPLDASNLIVSPTGTHLAFTMDVFPGMSITDTKAKLDAIENSKVSGRIYEQLFIRHWDTWNDGRRSHMFVIPVSGGNPVDVMLNMDADTPSKPFGGTEEITFTPDGKSIVFTAKDVGRSEAWSTDYDLYVASIDGSTPPRCITASNEAWDIGPVFSPDGKTLAYLAMARPGYEADRYRVMLYDWKTGAVRSLTEDWSLSPSEIFWSPDSKKIYAKADYLAQGALFEIEIKSGKRTLVRSDGTVRSPGCAGDRLVFGLDNLKSPVELYSMKTNGKGLKQLTTINADKLATIRFGDYEQFTFAGWNNETVYGYLVKPVDFDPDKKYPVAFLIHGGPQGSFGNDFHYRWNPQSYAGAGYAAVMVDFHGSTGYGQEFCDAIRGDWGGKPLEDLQKGLAAALAKYPFLDGDHVGALGASYGGYMINWIAGNWPDRFRCLVCHDGNIDERMAYFDTEELWFPEWDHEGTPWDNPEGYEKHNPVNFVKNWKTPMLVVHGGQDFRVAETQGFGTFNALQRRGIPSKLLYFPDENHWVLKPHNSILWHNTVIGWLDQWCK
ncbi:S9 family peptidase [candidate division KSB1 bacterium]|nr:S9 family peptidase [candidate division KSB1 bacterium]